MDCPFCGAPLGPDAVTCPSCGEAVDDPKPAGTSVAVVAIVVLLGLAAVCAVGMVIAAIAIPNLLSARKAGNEASAIGALKTISSCQALFREGDKDNDEVLDYGDLQELGDANLIDQVLASGVKGGYVFDVQPSTTSSEFLWMATASPSIPGQTGDRYYAITQDGILYTSLVMPIVLDPETCKVPQERLDSGEVFTVR